MPRSIKKSPRLHRAYRRASPSSLPSTDCRLYLNFAVRWSRPRNSKQISWPDCAELTVHYPNDCCGLSGWGSSSLGSGWAYKPELSGHGWDWTRQWFDLKKKKGSIPKYFTVSGRRKTKTFAHFPYAYCSLIVYALQFSFKLFHNFSFHEPNPTTCFACCGLSIIYLFILAAGWGTLLPRLQLSGELRNFLIVAHTKSFTSAAQLILCVCVCVCLGGVCVCLTYAKEYEKFIKVPSC